MKKAGERPSVLAAATGSHPGALYRLLRALASVGVFAEEAERHFGLTPLGDCLRADAAEPVGPWAVFIGRPQHSRRHGAAVLAAYDFGRFGCLVDVAGGQGAFLAAILAQYPVLRGVLFDQPHVVERAKAVLRAAGVDGRCRVVSGSFFEAIPTSGDAYMLKFILHDNMLVGPGGQERTQEEYASLFALAGFRLVRVTGTASEVSVIEGAAV